MTKEGFSNDLAQAFFVAEGHLNWWRRLGAMLGRIALLPVPVGQRTWFDFVVLIGLQRVELRPAEALSKRVRTGVNCATLVRIADR